LQSYLEEIQQVISLSGARYPIKRIINSIKEGIKRQILGFIKDDFGVLEFDKVFNLESMETEIKVFIDSYEAGIIIFPEKVTELPEIQ
jgi:hypothetical protein